MAGMPLLDDSDAAKPWSRRARLYNAFVAFLILVLVVVVVGVAAALTTAVPPQVSHTLSQRGPGRKPGASLYARKRLSPSHTLSLSERTVAILGDTWRSTPGVHHLAFKTGVPTAGASLAACTGTTTTEAFASAATLFAELKAAGLT